MNNADIENSYYIILDKPLLPVEPQYLPNANTSALSLISFLDIRFESTIG